MKALITGASSGIGKDMAYYLHSLGHELILVANDKEKLENVKKDIGGSVKIISMDLSIPENCFKLYNLTKRDNIDILINNAGFGAFGEFISTDMDKELNMINVNITAVHILTKLFLKDFVKRDSGYILNVSSSAAFQAGPLMATYYGTKAYVLRLTTAIYEELRKLKSNVHVSVLCPGPVKTNFNNVANVKFEIKSTTTVKAIAVKTGMIDSKVASAEFTKKSGSTGGGGGGGTQIKQNAPGSQSAATIDSATEGQRESLREKLGKARGRNFTNKTGLGFYLGNNDGSITYDPAKPYKAYLKVPTAQAAQIKKFLLNPQPTHVDGINVNEQENDKAIYDISGRRVENPTPGFYIQGNKKIVIR